jgi:hypothetical protein
VYESKKSLNREIRRLGTPLRRQLDERGANLENATRDIAHAVARVGGSAPVTPYLAAAVIPATRSE